MVKKDGNAEQRQKKINISTLTSSVFSTSNSLMVIMADNWPLGTRQVYISVAV